MRHFLSKLLLLLVSTLLAYGVAELVYTALYMRGIIDPPSRDGWFFEEAGRTIHFDPVIGYRLTTIPSRMERITDGVREYEGEFRGNNQGFQDRDDFLPQRTTPGVRRIAVLGDSFSSGQFLSINWPDRTEDLLAQQTGRRTVQLLNFSLYSGGLANWRNILIHIIEGQGYQLDGIVFPVYGNDLFRPFMLFEGRDNPKLLIGRAGWDPAGWPRTLEEARPLLSESDGFVLTHRQWEDFHAGQWHPDLPRLNQPYFAQHVAFMGLFAWTKLTAWLAHPAELWAAVTAAPAPPAGEPVPALLDYGQFSAEQWRLAEEVAAACRRLGVPVTVVSIPDRDELQLGAGIAPNVRQFAALLDARLVDGSEAFAGLTPAERRAQFFPSDAHWNQQGSDRFARFMAGQLAAP